MKKKHIGLFALLGSGSFAVALWYGTPSAPKTIMAHANPIAVAAARRPTAEQQLWKEQEITAKSQGATTNDLPAGGGEFTQLIDRALDTADGLKKFHNLKAKALRTAAENREYYAILSDVGQIRDAVEDLLNSEVSQENEVRRVVAVQYLVSAVAWEDNPGRDEALAAVNEVLLTVPGTDLPIAHQQSLYGDKIEMFQYLLGAAPAEAGQIKSAAQGTRMERFLWVAERMVTPQDVQN